MPMSSVEMTNDLKTFKVFHKSKVPEECFVEIIEQFCEFEIDFDVTVDKFEV